MVSIVSQRTVEQDCPTQGERRIHNRLVRAEGQLLWNPAQPLQNPASDCELARREKALPDCRGPSLFQSVQVHVADRAGNHKFEWLPVAQRVEESMSDGGD